MIYSFSCVKQVSRKARKGFRKARKGFLKKIFPCGLCGKLSVMA